MHSSILGKFELNRATFDKTILQKTTFFLKQLWFWNFLLYISDHTNAHAPIRTHKRIRSMCTKLSLKIEQCQMNVRILFIIRFDLIIVLPLCVANGTVAPWPLTKHICVWRPYDKSCAYAFAYVRYALQQMKRRKLAHYQHSITELFIVIISFFRSFLFARFCSFAQH